ncbi:hypothetical protein [Falsiroseomonas sp. HW251]|uniref:hypothetical protein n=1 Tax=Falsiroseomonas sp. HW251 TaxID=3390998 RepID=UPI003D320B06
MTGSITTRRHADGALDLDHHRRRAARLRRLALRRAWRAAGARLRRVALPMALLAAAAGPCFAQDWRAEPLPPEPRPGELVFRMTLLELSPGAATAPQGFPAETLVLVTQGTVIRDRGDGEPVPFAAGVAFAAEGPVVLRNPGAGWVRLSIGSLAAPDAIARPLSLWEGAE